MQRHQTEKISEFNDYHPVIGFNEEIEVGKR